MSDHDAAPDPIDKAYAQAEAVLSDGDERAARRARVLAAVAREPATPPAAPRSLPRRAWRRGGWLAAASVAGLGVFLATQVYPPDSIRPTPRPAAPVVSEAAGARNAAAPPPPAGAPSLAAESTSPRSRSARPPAAPPSSDLPVAEPPLAPPRIAESSGPAAAAPPAPAPSGGQAAVVVTARRRAEAPASSSLNADTADAAGPAESSVKPTPPPRLAMSQPHDVPPAARSSGAPTPDQAVRLRAAAAAGRIDEVTALLAEGVPVDAPDADGETALMRSIKARRPAAAALLLRRGASLDRVNQAGESARDMARSVDDPKLNQALGLER